MYSQTKGGLGNRATGQPGSWGAIRDLKATVYPFFESVIYLVPRMLCLCCFVVFSNSSNRGMSKQYHLPAFLEFPKPGHNKY